MSNESIEDKNQPDQADVISLCEYRKRKEEKGDDFDTKLSQLEKSCEKLSKAIRRASNDPWGYPERRCPDCGKLTKDWCLEDPEHFRRALNSLYNYVTAARTVRTMRERFTYSLKHTTRAIRGCCFSCQHGHNDKPAKRRSNKGRA